MTDNPATLPQTCLVARAGGTGLADLQLVEEPLRAPGEGEVLLEMLRMTINPADLLLLEGRYGHQPSAPFTPGAEGMGRVLAVGAGVRGLAPGDLAMPAPTANWRSHRVLKAPFVVPLPADADPDQAAMLKANPATALVMLEELVSLSPGDWVVMNAGNSALGQNVLRLAGTMGVNVAAIVRREGAATLPRSLGAAAVLVDDGTGPAPALPGGAQARLALDAVGGAATERLGAMVADGGTVVTYGLLSGAAPRLSAHDLVFRGLTLRGFWLADWFANTPPERIRALFDRLTDHLAKGVIGAKVEARFALTDLHAAVESAAREGRDGKILLTGGGA